MPGENVNFERMDHVEGRSWRRLFSEIEANVSRRSIREILNLIPFRDHDDDATLPTRISATQMLGH